MRRELTISFALLMIMFSTAIPGVYALEDSDSMEIPEMDATQMKEMTLEMIENNIDALTTLQSETDDDDTLESIDSLLEQMESLKTELEDTDDEDAVEDIMNELRTMMEEAPEEVRESLMQQNGPGGERGMGEMEPMEGESMMGNGTMQAPEGAPDGEFPGNGSMGDGAQMGRPDEGSTDSDSDNSADSTTDSNEETTGLLSGLINMLKSLF
ncbi:hypothetical protein [Methanolobus vulcani]|jgi:hypothetical protein|uniref:Uncharacterized protein n=1 Tax=Methanolobus vulcani TaxID=38026 RepID=A0A7Z8KMQ9_9EURY|nr:hypothetical protein [Methanolobus vulcani]TQD24952.1 hypothetical protein FKV42_07740 [Methanolobus vulcani]